MTIKEALEGAEFVPAFPGDEDVLEDDATSELHTFDLLDPNIKDRELFCMILQEMTDSYGLTIVGMANAFQDLLLKTSSDMSTVQAIHVGACLRLLFTDDNYMVSLYVKGAEVFIYLC